MEKAFRDVLDFEVSSGRGIPSGRPLDPTSVANVEFVMRLIEEEHKETMFSLDMLRKAMLNNEPITDENIASIADGFADSVWVNVAGAARLAIDLPAVWDEVDRANRDKFGPGFWIREDSKVMKPPGWLPPDIIGVITNQRPLSETYGEHK